MTAAALLHPIRRPIPRVAPRGCRAVTFQGLDISLAGWRCDAPGRSRGTVVYLHGVADNRSSGVGVIQRFHGRGFDVVAYDSRAHGESGGDVCTYGFLEKQDLRRVLDSLDSGPVVLLGTSLGAAVALEAAAEDVRVTALVAAEPFADLRTVAIERAPFFVSAAAIAKVFQAIEEKGRFRIDAVRPVEAAAKITAPVLLVHGEADSDTLPDHSRRVFAALRGPRRLIIVPGATHTQSLSGGEVWKDIQRWVDGVVGSALSGE